jgi:hypothetical protein
MSKNKMIIVLVIMAIGIAAMVTTIVSAADAIAPQPHNGPPAGKIGGCVQYTVGFIHFFGGGVAGPGNSGVVYTCKNNPP